MTLYNNLKSMAAQLLDKFGMPIIIRRTSSTFDPVTGKDTAAQSKDYQAVGILADFNRNEIDGTLIQRGDKKVTMTGVKPHLSDVLVASDQQYTVQGIEEINPAGTVILWDLHVRL